MSPLASSNVSVQNLLTNDTLRGPMLLPCQGKIMGDTPQRNGHVALLPDGNEFLQRIDVDLRTLGYET